MTQEQFEYFQRFGHVMMFLGGGIFALLWNIAASLRNIANKK